MGINLIRITAYAKYQQSSALHANPFRANCKKEKSSRGDRHTQHIDFGFQLFDQKLKSLKLVNYLNIVQMNT